jgi:hypothetical protein
MLNADARAELLVHAAALTLNDLAPDCLSLATLGAGADTTVVVRWHTDGVHGTSNLPPVWLSIGSAVVDSRGIEVLAVEIVEPEVRRHLIQDHPERT